MLRFLSVLAALPGLWVMPAAAEEVRITPDMAEVRVSLGGQDVVIARVQDTAATLQGEAALVARACPPDCIQPMQAGAGVATDGALEVISFLQGPVAERGGYLVDVRLPAAFATGHLPGAVNVPGVTLSPANPALRDILLALGASEAGGALDFSAAPVLLIYGAGPVFDEAARAVQGLMEAGYPAEKLRYFRGGMQEWLQFGLTVAGASDAG